MEKKHMLSFAEIYNEWEIFNSLPAQEKYNHITTFIASLNKVDIVKLTKYEREIFYSICKKLDYADNLDFCDGPSLVKMRVLCHKATGDIPEPPVFKYHPYPIKTGAAVEKEIRCQCCNQLKIYAYEVEWPSITVCLDCIADGSVASKLGVKFVDYGLHEREISPQSREELCFRTPGFPGIEWLSHCNEPCAFYGEVTKKDLMACSNNIEFKAFTRQLDSESVDELINAYYPSDLKLFKFVCIKCNAILAFVSYDYHDDEGQLCSL